MTPSRPPALLIPVDPPGVVPSDLAPGAEPVGRSNWQQFRRRFFRHKMAVISLGLLIVMGVLCFGARWFAPFPKNHIDLQFLAVGQGPTAKHWFGVDYEGQDVLSQALYGGQISLLIGLSVAVFSTFLGIVVGALAGYYRGWTDQSLSGLTDLFLVIPDIAIIAVAVRRLGRSDAAFIIVLAGLGWMYIARVVRGEVLALREKEFVEAARASGASNTRIIVRHVLPNCIGPIMVNLTLAIAGAVTAESTLSYLGLGLQPPSVSWGIMLEHAQNATTDSHRFTLLFVPAAFLILTVIAVNFVGDGLRDAFDPRSRR